MDGQSKPNQAVNDENQTKVTQNDTEVRSNPPLQKKKQSSQKAQKACNLRLFFATIWFQRRHQIMSKPIQFN